MKSALRLLAMIGIITVSWIVVFLILGALYLWAIAPILRVFAA